MRTTIFLLTVCALGCGGGSKEPQAPDGVANCTAMGCIDGLHVDFSPNAGWPSGHYRFIVEAGGKTTTCEGDLPLRACSEGPSLRCDGEGVMIGESGCALPPAEHGFSDLELRDGPAEVRLTIERDGARLVTKSMKPAYRTTQPNGPGCEPVCRQAAERIDLK